MGLGARRARSRNSADHSRAARLDLVGHQILPVAFRALRRVLFKILWCPTLGLLHARRWLSTGYDDVSWFEQQMVFLPYLLISAVSYVMLVVCRRIAVPEPPEQEG